MKPTLQLSSSTKSSPSNIFALGDVAETPGPKMARAGMMQAEIACSNICSLTRNQGQGQSKKGEIGLQDYVPMAVEGALSLSLGRDASVQYMKQDDGKEFLMPGKWKGVDLEVEKMWGLLGMKMREDMKEVGA